MPSNVNPRSGPFPIYSSTSPPTVDVGIFTISKTGVDLKNAGTTTIFTVPAGRMYIALSSAAFVTAVTGGGAGTESYQIKESSASRAINPAVAGASTTPVANQTFYSNVANSGAAALSSCAAGNSVQVVVSTSHAGSTAVTGTVYVTGFYVQ